MNSIKLYTRNLCGWCIEAKQYLRDKNLFFEEVDVGADAAAYEEMVKLSGQRYVPTIVVNGRVLANFDVGQLDRFLVELGIRPRPD